MWKTRHIDASVKSYFAEPAQALHRQYLAMRSFFLDEESAETVASNHGYTVNTVYQLSRDFRLRLENTTEQGGDPFFHVMKDVWNRQSHRSIDLSGNFANS